MGGGTKIATNLLRLENGISSDRRLSGMEAMSKGDHGRQFYLRQDRRITVHQISSCCVRGVLRDN